MLIRPPQFVRRLYPSFVWNFHDDRDGVYLTFDDGPCPQVTPWVLDELDEYGAKATFFVLGRNVELYPRLFEEIIRRGHAVGNHSYSHVNGWHVKRSDYVRDVDMADGLIHSRLFRPPYAKVTPHQIRELGGRFHCIMWSILSRDYSPSLSEKGCAGNVLPFIAPGEIVVFHDSVKAARNMWHTLPLTLDAAKSKNLICKPITL